MLNTAEASGHVAAATSLVDQINSIILFPLITFLLAIAVIVFIWGGFQYLYKADDASARSEGQKHMLFGIIGIVVMISAFTLLSIATRTFFGNAAVPTP